MEQTIRVPVSPKNTLAGEKWIGLAILAVVFSLFRLMGDPVKVAVLAVGLGLLPLALGNRALLIFLTALSFYLAGTSTHLLSQICLYARWIFLAACLVVAFVYPFVFHVKVERVWKERKWRWFFCGLAFASMVYSVSPMLTLERGVTLAALFFVISALIKPFAAAHGPGKIIDLFLYAAAPLYFLSLFLIGDKSAYLVNDLVSLQQLRASTLYAKALGMSSVTFGRFFGLFMSPNTLGVLAALLFPLVTQKVFQEKRKTFYLFLLGTMSVLLVLSGSREGMIGSLVSGAYVLCRLLGKRKLLRWAVMGLPLMLLLSPILLSGIPSGQVKEYLRTGNARLGGGRVEAWVAAASIIGQRPLLGYGFGTEDLLFKRARYRFLLHEGAYAHNSYIGLVMQVGLLGALLFFIPLLILLFSELRAENPSGPRIALQGMLLSGLIVCLTESWIYSVGGPQAFIFWSGIAVLEILRDTERRVYTENE